MSHETTAMKNMDAEDSSKSANVVCHPVETKTIRDSRVLIETKDMNEDGNQPKEVVNKSVHESLESFNVSEASKCGTTTERKEIDVSEDFADLTISEKEILAVIGEEVEEDITKHEVLKEKKISIPSSNVVAKLNIAQVA